MSVVLGGGYIAAGAHHMGEPANLTLKLRVSDNQMRFQ